MKKIFLLAAVAAVTCFAACKKTVNPEPTPGPGPGPETKDAISVSPSVVSFEGEGGKFNVAVLTNVASFTVSGNPDWLTVTTGEKEISLAAAANTVAEPRSCSLTVTAGTASCFLTVNQKAGSPYTGFTVCPSATFEYAGTMLYMFLKPSEEDYGGTGYISMADEDGNTLSIWVYTELFASEEEVELTAGTYRKGTDNYPYSLTAKKMTYVPGVSFTFSDEGEDDEANVSGSIFTNQATGEVSLLTDGQVEVISNADGTQVILVDMTAADGTPFKYVFMGQVEIDAEGAGYPSTSERIDVAATLFGAECYYRGDVYGNGTSNFQLYLYSGDPEDPAMTVYDFMTAAVDFSEDIDLSGEYYTPSEGEEGEEPVDPFAAGNLIPGSLVELFPGFEMPIGTYIMYSFGDYLMADAFASLVLERQEDGKYTLTSALMSTTDGMVMFMGDDFTGVHDLEIPIIDGRENGED